MTRIISLFLSFLIRIAQIVFAAVSLGLSAGLLVKIDYTYDRAVYVIVVSSLTLLYLAAIVGLYRFTPPLVVLLVEGMLMILWLAAFAAMADVYGDTECVDFSGDIRLMCMMGKALIAFGVALCVSFMVSSFFLMVFSVVPLARASGVRSLAVLGGRELSPGCIFLRDAPASDPKTDGAASAADDKVADPAALLA